MSPVGRPEVGTPINVRLGDELLADIDDRAAKFGVSRAEMIRRMLRAAVAELAGYTGGSFKGY